MHKKLTTDFRRNFKRNETKTLSEICMFASSPKPAGLQPKYGKV